LLSDGARGIIVPSGGREGIWVGEVINWEEKYVSYVEGDLRRDIQELKEGQKALDAKIDARVQELKEGHRVLDAKIDNGLKALDAKIDDVRKALDAKIDNGLKALDAKIDDVRKELSGKIDRVTYIILGAFGVALIGGLIKLFIG